MKLPVENAELRRALDFEQLDAYAHRDEVRRLQRRFRHTIRFDGMHHFETCAPYALKLTDHPAYEGVRHAHRTVFAGSDFMAWLIERHLVELDTPMVGCLVCYFAAGRWKHVGVMLAGNRVRSKWGVMPRYEHDMAEVPAEYGQCVRFYERPPPAMARRRFREFALEQGLTERDIEAAIAARP